MANSRQFWLKALAVFLLILSIIYIIVPIDFDGPIWGIFDDFFFFMSGFCFCQGQFLSSRKQHAKQPLNKVALVFLILGIVYLCILAFTPMLKWVA